jgi:hypothetical protein
VHLLFGPLDGLAVRAVGFHPEPPEQHRGGGELDDAVEPEADEDDAAGKGDGYEEVCGSASMSRQVCEQPDTADAMFSLATLYESCDQDTPGDGDEGDADAVRCVKCHADVGHGEPAGLGGPMTHAERTEMTPRKEP